MSISVLNTDSDLTAKTLVTAEGDRTITGNFTFSRSPSAPFTVPVGSAVVSNLDANFLQGQLGSFYRNASNLNAGTVPTAQLGSGSASTATYLRGDSTWATVNGMVNQFRLTLATATPVTTADVTAATTLFCTPYGGNAISLFDGSTNWNTRTSAEFSIAIPNTTSQLYDVFCFDNAGVPTLELLAWTNDTTRATALVLQNGILVKSGATTRRYMGSCRTTAVAGQTEDSLAKRYVWNYYNRVHRAMRVTEPTDSYPYTTDTYRQANANPANQLDVVVGFAEVMLAVRVVAQFSSGSADQFVMVSIGEDSTTTAITGVLGQGSGSGAAGISAADPAQVAATLERYPAVGRHTYVWLERAGGGGTVTWYGDNANSAKWQGGISGWIEG